MLCEFGRETPTCPATTCSPVGSASASLQGESAAATASASGFTLATKPLDAFASRCAHCDLPGQGTSPCEIWKKNRGSRFGADSDGPLSGQATLAVTVMPHGAVQ